MLKPITISVPATTANLGAGYDLIGMALNIHNKLTFTPAEQYTMECAGPYAPTLPFQLTPRSLIWKGVASVYAAVQKPMPCFQVHQDIHIPPARGLGSSSGAIVAGLFAANYWLDSPFPKSKLLEMATQIEGHPDNVAPALLGGCILNFPGATTEAHTKIPLPKDLYWGVCIPRFQLKTRDARRVVPEQCSLKNAVLNMSYLGALITGLSTNNHALISQGLKDTLHQPYRSELVPGMNPVMQAAVRAGALGCVLSGAGPTLLVVSAQPLQSIAQEMEKVWKKHKITADFVTCLIDHEGVVCLD